MRKNILLFIITIILSFFPLQVRADEGWVIDKFQSNIEILQNGKIQVNEIIDVDFNSLQKHGIYRDIPYIYYSSNGNNIYTDLQISSVLQNGSIVAYQISKEGNYERLKIGDPAKLISGKLEYQINYSATGVLRSFEDHDELYWDVTGNGWPVLISKVLATVTLPQNGITATACFEGVQKSNEKCSSQILTQNKANFESARSLKSNEGVTIVLGYTKGMMPILTVTPPPLSYNRTYSTSQTSSPNPLTLALSLSIGLGLSYWLWSKNGRDLWWKREEPGSNNLNTIVVEYNPPDNLKPAEVGTILDERADTLDVTATIIDLASKGFLTITEIDKKWIFGSTDYILDRKNKDTTNLLGYEKTLLDKIFAGSDTVKISELKNDFYDDLVKVKKVLYQNVLDKQYFAGDPEKVKSKYLTLGIVVLILGIGLMVFGFFEPTGIIQGVGWGLLVSGIILTILSQSMPRRTSTGHEAYLKILGFKLFIEKAEKYRQQFFERKNIFNEILPYAIVFGATEKFAQAFKDLGLKPVQPSWYISSRPFNTYLFAANINNFSSSLTSAIASQPRSNSFVSSGSGFSGGFSGGGFGGGGGGSW